MQVSKQGLGHHIKGAPLGSDFQVYSTQFQSYQTRTLALYKAASDPTYLKGGGRIPPPPPALFRPKHPEGQQNVGVTGYVNLSYYIGKTPEKVSGPKNFFWPVRKPAKSDRRKI